MSAIERFAAGLFLAALLVPSVAFGQLDPEARLAAAEEALARAEAIGRHPDAEEARRRDPALTERLADGRRLLGYARDALERAGDSSSARTDAAVLARRAGEEFDTYREAMRSLFDAIERERNPPPPPPPPPPSPPPPPPSPPPDTGPPETLRRAAAAHLAGDYEKVEELLDDIAGLRPAKARAHALLLRASARYARHLLDGEGDAALRGLAVEDVRALRALDPELAPPEEIFSPRFRDFFASVR